MEGTRVYDAETGQVLVIGNSRKGKGRNKDGDLDEEAERARQLKEKATQEKEARKKALLSLQHRQHEYLKEVIQEEMEAEKQRELQWRMEPHARKLLQQKFQRERQNAQERIERLKRENELVLASKMADLSLLR